MPIETKKSFLEYLGSRWDVWVFVFIATAAFPIGIRYIFLNYLDTLVDGPDDLVMVTFMAWALSSFYSIFVIISTYRDYRLYLSKSWVLCFDEDTYMDVMFSEDTARQRMLGDLHHSFPYIEDIFDGHRYYRHDPYFLVKATDDD